MLKKHVKYQGFDGEIIEEDLYFNLTRMDAIELSARYEGKDLPACIWMKSLRIKILYPYIEFLKISYF